MNKLQLFILITFLTVLRCNASPPPQLVDPPTPWEEYQNGLRRFATVACLFKMSLTVAKKEGKKIDIKTRIAGGLAAGACKLAGAISALKRAPQNIMDTFDRKASEYARNHRAKKAANGGRLV